MIDAHLLHNDEILSSASPCLCPGQIGVLSGWGVFSTIRVSRGVLFEFPRHYARMKRDALNLRVPFPEEPSYIEARLHRLIEANEAYDSTLRVIVTRNKGNVWEGPNVPRDFDLVAFTTELTNWGTGVKLGVVPQARHSEGRFAGTKMLSWAFNLTWYEEAHERGLDEVILLNERDEVAECTSANIFAVFGNEARTPPLSSGCLAGITREVLLNEIRAPGITLSERVLRLGDLEQADEVFITSSTRNVLPVLSVEGLNIRQSRAVSEQLSKAFHEYIERYVALHSRLQPI